MAAYYLKFIGGPPVTGNPVGSRPVFMVCKMCMLAQVMASNPNDYFVIS